MKLLAHLTPRAGAAADLERAVRVEGRRLADTADLSVTRVNAMLRVAKDLFGRRTRHTAALELVGDSASAEQLSAEIAGLGDRLNAVVHPDLCTALVGEDEVYIACAPTPIRYQYLMRRNAEFTHDTYQQRYREIHSQFGLKTPGILGYVQFHVDPAASRATATAAGFGVWGVDSVSELHLESVEHFLAEIAKSSIGAEAVTDEELFVDRPCSFDFCSSVEALRA